MIEFILPNGMQIKCETLEEAKVVSKEFAGKIDEVLTHQPRGPGVGRPRRPISSKNKEARSPGSGPEESWARALWYIFKHEQITRNEARTVLAKMKKNEPQKFYGLDQQFREWEGKLGDWYGNKHKKPKEEAIAELRQIGREQQEAFFDIAREFEKPEKKKR
jgi:hypothetical protein